MLRARSTFAPRSFRPMAVSTGKRCGREARRMVAILALLVSGAPAIVLTQPAVSSPNSPSYRRIAAAWNGTWSRIRTVPAMRSALAVRDTRRERMIVIAGGSSETWALSMRGGLETWFELPALGAGVSPWDGSAGVYDPISDRVVLYGARINNARNEVWQLTLSPWATWSRLTPAGEGPLSYGGAAAA
jgi:hypothetical protein